MNSTYYFEKTQSQSSLIGVTGTLVASVNLVLFKNIQLLKIFKISLTNFSSQYLITINSVCTSSDFVHNKIDSNCIRAPWNWNQFQKYTKK